MSRNLLHFLLPILLLFAACTHDNLDVIPSENPSPEDDYVGDNKSLVVEYACGDLDVKDVTLFIMTDSGDVIKRRSTHSREDNKSYFQLSHGVKEGTYRLLHMEYDVETLSGDSETWEVGLGCKVHFNGVDNGEILTHWNNELGMYSSGTEVDTVYISHASHLLKLKLLVSDAKFNAKIDKSKYLLQVADIDGYYMASQCGAHDGWEPIGAMASTPFRGIYDGGGFAINDLWIERENTISVGLFGYTYGAFIRNVTLNNASISGDLGVGGIVGVALSGTEDRRNPTVIENCVITESEIKGNPSGFGVGGVIGCVDKNGAVVILNSTTKQSAIDSHYNAGGLVGTGFKYSTVMAINCENSSDVTSRYSGSGGIVGTCDSLYVYNCINRGSIRGAQDYTAGDVENGGIGAGGIAGAAGTSFIATSTNYGNVEGYTGVGGIIGSSRYTMEGDSGAQSYQTVYGNSIIRYCGNEGNVSAYEIAGGICGEAQVSVYGGYNKGAVKAEGSYAGGIVGNGALSIIFEAANEGDVAASGYAGGIASVMGYGMLASNFNSGRVTSSGSHAAGIVSFCGNNSTINYCANYGDVQGDEISSGVVGEAGYDIVISNIEIAQLVVGFTEVISAFVTYLQFATLYDVDGEPGFVTLFISEVNSAIGDVCYLADLIFLGIGINDIVIDVEDLRAVKDLEANVENSYQSFMATKSGMLSSLNVVNGDFDTQTISENIRVNMSTLSNYLNSSETSLNHFVTAMNDKREDHREVMLQEKLGREICHTVVAGIATALCTVGEIVDFATKIYPSPTAAAVGTMLSMAGSVIGGMNSVIQVLSTPEYNAVDITQCVNVGNVMGRGGDVGGVIAVMQDHTIVSDCLNMGSGNGVGGHLVGSMAKRAELRNSLSVASASSWEYIVGGVDETNNVVEGLYYYGDAMSNFPYATALSSEQMNATETYSSWDIGTTQNLWTLVKSSGVTFPIPYVSEFAM